MRNHAFPETWRHGLYEAIVRRRDIRAFLPDPIPYTILARILSAANQAGSVGFSQPWNFIVVENLELRQQVSVHVERERLRAADSFPEARREKYLAFKLEGVLDAPINLCVTCDQERFGPAVIGRHTIPETAVYSTCCAIQNLWLAARAEGVGVGWVSIMEPGALRKILGIPDRIIPVAYLCIGFVENFPERPMLETAGWLPKLPLQQLVFHDRWGEEPQPTLLSALVTTRIDGDKPSTEPPPIACPADGNQPPESEPARTGLLLVYTGQGKGKTTAALGIVFRALGRGLRVAVVQFIKGKWKTGERLFAERIPGLTFLVMGQGFTWESDDLTQDRNAAVEAWAKTKELIASGEHAVVVLDEITYAINYGFIALTEVLAVLRERPTHVHVVVTGRKAQEELCVLADLVTEMKSVKHPFEQGRKAQRGIDY